MTTCYFLAERSFKANLSPAGSLWAAQHTARDRGCCGRLEHCRVEATATKRHNKSSVLPQRNIVCLREDLWLGCQGRAAFNEKEQRGWLQSEIHEGVQTRRWQGMVVQGF